MLSFNLYPYQKSFSFISYLHRDKERGWCVYDLQGGKAYTHKLYLAVVFDGVHGLLDANESLPYPDKVAWKYIDYSIC